MRGCHTIAPQLPADTDYAPHGDHRTRISHERSAHMLRRILVPLDGSELAEAALPVAARLARTAGGVILLARVIRAPAEYEASLAATDAWIPPARPEERDEAAAYLTRLSGWEVLAGIPTEIHIRPGPVALLLLRLIRDEQVDTVVMTSHGRSELSRLLMGSVATAV